MIFCQTRFCWFCVDCIKDKQTKHISKNPTTRCNHFLSWYTLTHVILLMLHILVMKSILSLSLMTSHNIIIFYTYFMKILN